MTRTTSLPPHARRRRSRRPSMVIILLFRLMAFCAVLGLAYVALSGGSDVDNVATLAVVTTAAAAAASVRLTAGEHPSVQAR